MRISDRYIGRQILSGTLFAIVLLTLLLVIGNIFKEIRTLLVDMQAPIGILWQFILNVLPVSMIFTIPWAFLSAVLLVFGRLSSDNELNGFRVAGMSLLRLAAPVFILGLALSLLCVWLNVSVSYKAKRKVDNIEVYVARLMIKQPQKLLRAGLGQTVLQGVRVDTEFSEDTGFNNFHVFMPASERGPEAYIHADTAEAVVYEDKQQIHLRLTNAYIDGDRSGDEEFILTSDDLQWMVIDYSERGLEKATLSSMSNEEIYEFVENWPPPPDDASPELLKVREKRIKKALAKPSHRYAASFACLAFAFIGVPLGIKARRRDTSTGLVLSLVIGAAYFMSGTVIGDAGWEPWSVWIPNLVCIVLGIFLFRRARFR